MPNANTKESSSTPNPFLDDMPTLDDEFGCDPWDDDNFGEHAASTYDDKKTVRGCRW